MGLNLAHISTHFAAKILLQNVQKSIGFLDKKRWSKKLLENIWK